MSDQDFELDFDVSVDRRSMLAEAARLVDKREAHLGPDGTVGKSPDGEKLRALLGDGAEWAEGVEAYEISDRDFLARQLEAPVPFRQLEKEYRFLWLRLPIFLDPKLNWGFNKLIARIEFNPELAGSGGRPTAYQILPDRKFQTLLQAGDYLDIHMGLDSGFKLNQKVTLPTAIIGGAADATIGVEGVARAGAGAVVGPFVYRIVRAEIQHTDTGIEKVKWQIVGDKFFQDTVPRLVVIAQVPRRTEHVNIKAELIAYRFFNMGAAGLWQSLQDLPASLYDFFVKKGAPLYSCRLFEAVGEAEPRSRPCE